MGVTYGRRGTSGIGIGKGGLSFRYGRTTGRYKKRRRRTRRHGRNANDDSLGNQSDMPYRSRKRKSRKKGKSSKRGKKRYTNRSRRGKNCCKEIKAVAKKVSNIQKSLAVNLSHKTFRTSICSVLRGTPNASLVNEQAFTNTQLTGAGTVRMFDAGTDAAASVNIFTKEFGQDVRVTKCYDNYLMTNNGNSPVMIECWTCIPKGTHNTSAQAAWQNGLVDQGDPATGTILTTLVFPTDSDLFNQLWTIKGTKHRRLLPGQQFVCSMNHKPFTFKTSEYQQNSDVYDSKHGTWSHLFRFTGGLAHITDETKSGYNDYHLDTEYKTTIKVEYESGGFDFNDFSANDSQDPLTTNQFALMPVPAVLAYDA